MKYPKLVHDFLTLSADRYPSKDALVCENTRLTYQALDFLSDRFALGLVAMGEQRRDRVIIFLDNSPETIIALYGILKAGAIFVILNSSVKDKKLSFILQDSGANVLVTDITKAAVVKNALVETSSGCRIVWTGNSLKIPSELSSVSVSWYSLLAIDDVCAPENSRADRLAKTPACIDTDLAGLLYTSGSTGEPKAIMAPHQNMIAAARSIIHYLENREQDIILNLLPLSFDYGLYQVIMTFMFGGTLILDRSFLYPVKVLQTLEREQVTGFPIVPTIAAILLNLQSLKSFNLQSLRYITNTAAALPVDHIRRLREIFPHSRLYSMYGLTECKRATYLPPEEIDRRPKSVGKAIPNCEATIINTEGTEAAAEEEGELVIRGANVMRGYWNAPLLTAEIFRRDAVSGEMCLYSGDIFKKDQEGFLYFVRRKDDLIKSRGERVSPREVENVLCAMPGIAEAAVIGVPDELLGQAIAAYIVPTAGSGITEKDIQKFCVDNLETFMVPQYIHIMAELPRTPHGKIDKKALKAQANLE